MLLDIENKAIAEAYLKMQEAAAAKKKTDLIGKEDADIDNDGDTDSSDEYIHARRKAIAAKTKSEAMEVELPAKSKMGSLIKKDDEEDDEDDEDDDAVVVVKSNGGNKKKQDKESMEEGWEEKSKTKPAKPGVVTDKSGAKHDQMSRVRALANAAMQRTAAQQKNVKEDAESIDELSTNKLLNYRAAATKQLGKTSPETEQKRKAGLATSGTKIKSQLKKEDHESIDELSKDTLKSYVDKGARSALKLVKKANKNFGKSFATTDDTVLWNKGSKQQHAAYKRNDNVQKAKALLTKEDTDQLDELSKNTLRSYANKALTDVVSNSTAAGYSDAKNYPTKDYTKKVVNRSTGMRNAVQRLAKEDTKWDWDAIFDAPEHEVNTMIDEMSDQDLDSFVSEFEQIEEGSNWYQGSTNSIQPSDGMGREKLKSRAEADAAFADAHTDNVKVTDYPGKNDQHQAKMPQAPARPGDKRNNEAKKTLSDMRSGKK